MVIFIRVVGFPTELFILFPFIKDLMLLNPDQSPAYFLLDQQSWVECILRQKIANSHFSVSVMFRTGHYLLNYVPFTEFIMQIPHVFRFQFMIMRW